MKTDRLGLSFAVFDDTRRYRYDLGRTWDDSKPTCAFVMLNPSTADAFRLDPTIRRCAAFAKSWGFGSLRVGNLFALRSTDPNALYASDYPAGGAKNDLALHQMVREAERVVLAWGTHGSFLGRGDAVRRNVLREAANVTVAFGYTANRQPLHPLYVPSNAPLVAVA